MLRFVGMKDAIYKAEKLAAITPDDLSKYRLSLYIGYLREKHGIE